MPSDFNQELARSLNRALDRQLALLLLAGLALGLWMLAFGIMPY